MRYGPCFYCGKEILSSDKKRIVPLDRPYVNLRFHKVCLDSIPDIALLLTQNLQKVYNYIEKGNLSTKKGEKS